MSAASVGIGIRRSDIENTPVTSLPPDPSLELSTQQAKNRIRAGTLELRPGVIDPRISPEVKTQLVVQPLRTWMERHKQKLGPNYIDLSKKDIPWGDTNLQAALEIYQTYELLWAKKYYTDTPLADHHYRNLGINRDDIRRTVDQKTLASFLKNGLLIPDSQQGRDWSGTALPRISSPRGLIRTGYESLSPAEAKSQILKGDLVIDLEPRKGDKQSDTTLTVTPAMRQLLLEPLNKYVSRLPEKHRFQPFDLSGTSVEREKVQNALKVVLADLDSRQEQAPKTKLLTNSRSGVPEIVEQPGKTLFTGNLNKDALERLEKAGLVSTRYFEEQKPAWQPLRASRMPAPRTKEGRDVRAANLQQKQPEVIEAQHQHFKRTIKPILKKLNVPWTTTTNTLAPKELEVLTDWIAPKLFVKSSDIRGNPTLIDVFYDQKKEKIVVQLELRHQPLTNRPASVKAPATTYLFFTVPINPYTGERKQREKIQITARQSIDNYQGVHKVEIDPHEGNHQRVIPALLYFLRQETSESRLGKLLYDPTNSKFHIQFVHPHIQEKHPSFISKETQGLWALITGDPFAPDGKTRQPGKEIELMLNISPPPTGQ